MKDMKSEWLFNFDDIFARQAKNSHITSKANTKVGKGKFEGNFSEHLGHGMHDMLARSAREAKNRHITSNAKHNVKGGKKGKKAGKKKK